MCLDFFCEPGRIRTFDHLLRREVLYPAELRALTYLFNEVVVLQINKGDEKHLLRRGGRIRTCDLLVPNEAR